MAAETKKNVFIQTYGCQMNVYDSEKMLEQLRAANYAPTEDPEKADVFLVNTCAIREKAEHKVFSWLGKVGEIKQARPGVVIGVGGCVAQQKGQEIIKQSKHVDMVFGTDNLFDLPEMLQEVAQGGRPLRTEFRHQTQRIANFVPAFQPFTLEENETLPIKGSIAITKGCNNFCTFCVVPYTRGREVSREPENILEEARRMVDQGAKEITLLGQNVNSYKAGKIRFVDLLSELNNINGLERIRYTSPHPKDLKEELALAHRDLPKLCEHMHLPFQSGSDKILKAMQRNHTMDHYFEKVEMLRSACPEIAISTDIIVGFPGETEADFEKSLDAMRRVKFDHIYAFKFSPRNDTPAAKFEEQVSEEVKTDRLARLHVVHEENLGEIHAKMIGSRQEVFLEGPHPRDEGAMIGRSRGNISVTVVDCNLPSGSLVPVEVVANRKYSLVGKEVDHGPERIHRNEGVSTGV